LSSEQAAKAAVLAALESETVARKAEEVKVASLQEELVEKDTLITQLQESLKVLRKQLSDVVEDLAQERLSFERQLAELRQVIVTLGEEHAGAVAKLEAEIAHQREEKETVSMQLVSKIRQLRAERERADAAEADASLLAEKLAVMSARYDAAATELEVTAAELAAAKLRLAKLSLALDEERRTSSELRLTNLATVNRAERAEGRADELAARVALLEGELSEARARILQLEASVSRLESELSALREEFDAFRTEAARLQAEMEAALAKREGELLEAKSILETKDDQGRTLLERLAAGEERERMDAMRIRLLNKQYTAMVATYSDKDLLSTATPPASPLDSPARTPTRTPRRA
jgi:chromosome segregation ATPase